MKQIAQGAEAKIFLDDRKIVKDRVVKSYRLKEIDDRLRKFRTKREAKVISKLKEKGMDVPSILFCDEKERIEMDFIDGEKVRDVLSDDNYEELCKEIGEKIAVIHNSGIIHGDLTTSNMIFKDKVWFIDFGLSFFSSKVEDMAVDIHLLRCALESKHYKIWEKCYKVCFDSYLDKCDKGEEVLKRLEVVEKRGRYKH